MDNSLPQVTGIKRYWLLTSVFMFYATVIILIVRHQIIDGNGIPAEIDDSHVIDDGPSIDISVLYWTTATTGVSNITIDNTKESVDTTTGTYYDRDVDQNYSYAFVHKKQWSVNMWDAKCRTTELTLPVETVYVAESQTKNCYRYLDCMSFVYELQQQDFHPYGDIQYNFVVTGQGSIFEGLSWNCKVQNAAVDADAIMVLLTGYSKVSDYYINTQQYESLKLFLRYNVMMHNLSPTYTLKPLCCIVPGKNPGKILYWGLSAKFRRFYYHCNNPRNCTNT